MKDRRSTQRSMGVHPDLARRKFLGGLGSVALLAGGFGSVLTTPFARAAQLGAAYAAGSVGLELDGAFAGYLRDASGGEPVFDVTAAPTGGPIADKSVASRHSTPLEIGTASAMSATFYNWIAGFSEGKPSTHSGALVQFDYNRNPVRRLEFTDASIVAVVMPPLDAGATKERLSLTVTILPQSSSMVISSKGGPAAPTLQEKAASATIFKLQIRDLESASQNARRIEGIGVKAIAGPKGVSIDAGSLRVSFPESSAGPFYKWFDQCGTRECIERPGVIQFLSPTSTAQFGSIELVNLGITRVAPTWSVSGSDKAASVTVDFYCEQQRFNLGSQAFA